MAYQPVERGTPESTGVSSRTLLEMLRGMDNCGTEMHGVMVYRHGKVIAEGWWAPYTRDTVHINHSFGKTYTAAAVGAAVRLGLLSTEDRIADIFAEDLKALDIPDEGYMARMKVKHVLSMTSGMEIHPDGGSDLVKNFLSTPLVHEPGTHFMYNTTGSSLLAEIVRRVSGMEVLDFIWKYVLDDAGFEPGRLRWARYTNGLHPAPGTAANTESNLRLGVLFLNGGAWNGKQLLDPEFVRQATVRQSDGGTFGYGYQMWMNDVPGTYRFLGGHGQDCIVSPAADIVVAIHQAGSEPHDTAAVEALVNQHLLSKTWPDSLPEDPKAQQELQEFLSSREIPQPGAAPCHALTDKWIGHYTVTEGRFHFNTELLPFGDMNVYEDFYSDPHCAVKTLDISRCPEGYLFTVNNSLQLIVRLDGRWVPHAAQSDMENYDLSCAAAILEDDTMIVNQWFFQTCFKTRLWLKMSGDTVTVKVRKERLHDGAPYIWREAVMQKK